MKTKPLPKIKLRHPKLNDAKRFYEILSNPNFIFFDAKVESVEQEKQWIKNSKINRDNGIRYCYAIIFNNEIVGGCSITINQHRIYIGEIGYHIAEEYWGKSLACAAVKELEKIDFNGLKLKRLEILVDTKHVASQKVAIKCGFKKEGLLKKVLKRKGRYYDCFIYSKIN